jgi:hypothetical protein
MNTRTNSILYLFAMLVGMMLLTACNPHQPNVVSASEPEPVEAIAADEFESVEPGEVVQVLTAELGIMQLRSAGFSGDDSYDPAAERLIDSIEEIKEPAEEHEFSQISGGSLSGDDVYDPAGNLSIEIPLGEHNFTPSGGANFSGDDDFDPAAGGEF